ncbi:MAG: efflux RND transporter periplasmic adaptor subunit, partial [Candidatus Cryosericum sp.]
MKKKRVIIAVIALVIVGAAVAGYVLLKAKAATASRTGTTRTAGSVYTVAAKDVATTTTVSGTVHPLRTVTLTAKAAGTITAVTRSEGDKVAAGEVIARIDSTDYQADLAAAESRYRTTMISLETAQTTDLAAARTQLENAVKQAQTQLLSAQISLKNGTDPDADTQTITNLQNQVTDAQETLASAQKSLKNLQDNDTSALQLEQADFAVKQAEFNLSMAQTKLATLKAQDVTEAQLTTLQNQVSQAKSSLLSAQVSLKEAVQSTATSDDRLVILQNQVDQAQSSLDQAQDNLKNASSDNKATQDEIDAQAMAVESAQMALTNAEANYKTTAASLADNSSLTAAQVAVTKAQRALTTAQANLTAGQKTIANKTDNVRLLEANVEQAKASVVTAQANLAAFPETQRKAELQIQSNEEAKKQALITLNQTKELADSYVITAPLAGTITALNVAVGDTANVGTSIATLSDVSGWYVSAYVDEVDILNVKAGEDASMTIDEYSGKTFSGTVSYVSHSLGTTSNSVSAYPIKIQMTDAPSTMVDGMSVDAAITVSVAKGVLAVPITAVISESGKKYVDVVSVDVTTKTMTTTKTEVKTGTEGDEYIEITSGLKAGD